MESAPNIPDISLPPITLPTVTKGSKQPDTAVLYPPFDLKVWSSVCFLLRVLYMIYLGRYRQAWIAIYPIVMLNQENIIPESK